MNELSRRTRAALCLAGGIFSGMVGTYYLVKDDDKNPEQDFKQEMSQELMETGRKSVDEIVKCTVSEDYLKKLEIGLNEMKSDVSVSNFSIINSETGASFYNELGELVEDISSVRKSYKSQEEIKRTLVDVRDEARSLGSNLEEYNPAQRNKTDNPPDYLGILFILAGVIFLGAGICGWRENKEDLN